MKTKVRDPVGACRRQSQRRAVGEEDRRVRAVLPSKGEIDKDTPLRLALAAKVGFPDGSVSVSALRREASRGRLIIERIAGRDYTTLRQIEAMRELCRVGAKDLDFTLKNAPTVTPSIASDTGDSNSALDSARARLQKLRKLSPTT
jgi:hypothetical protein